jgi:tetratricopeptide (TPR) repeat protein
MTTARIALLLGAAFTIAATVAAQQEPQTRPGNISVHTWVREDLFAGFLQDDMTRFERGEKKALEYLAEKPGRAEPTAWMVGIKLYRASRAFEEGRASEGDRLVQEALQAMDAAVASAPDNLGVHATVGGSVVTLANKLPDTYYRPLMERARTHFAALYRVQSPALPQLPLHIKGELLAGVAETEFRAGDRARATAALEQILKDMPGTPYANAAASWLSAPEKVTKDTKLVCQSCHEPGRLSSWLARQAKQ